MMCEGGMFPQFLLDHCTDRRVEHFSHQCHLGGSEEDCVEKHVNVDTSLWQPSEVEGNNMTERGFCLL